MIKRVLRRIKWEIEKLRGPNHAAIFSKIYKEKIWGSDGQQQFYSGSGSDEVYTLPYINSIIDFIKKNNIRSIVDLGCGDFRVGAAIVEATGVKYTGIDVVEDLVKYNQNQFGNENISFRYKNITKDNLPDGELCLIRQVLQHLSNKDILGVLQKTKKYKYLIITEHLPLGSSLVPNIDKVPDGSIRYYQNSGVYLDLPPFNRKIKELLSIEPIDHPNSRIVTFQIEG